LTHSADTQIQGESHHRDIAVQSLATFVVLRSVFRTQCTRNTHGMNPDWPHVQPFIDLYKGSRRRG